MIGTIFSFIWTTGLLLLILWFGYNFILQIRDKTFFIDPDNPKENDYLWASVKLFIFALILGGYLYFYYSVWFYNNNEEVGEWDGCILRGPNGECEISKYDDMPDPFDLRDYDRDFE